MPTLDDGDDCWRQSRTIQGSFTSYGETAGFRNIFFYIEKGLGDKFSVIAEIVLAVIKYHRKHGHSNGRIVLLGFGGKEDDLVLFESIFSARMVSDAGDVAGALCKISGITEVNGDITCIRNLFPSKIHINYAGVSAPREKDIVCFIKSAKELQMSKDAVIKYRRLLKPRSIWTLLDGSDVKVEAGLSPAEIADTK